MTRCEGAFLHDWQRRGPGLAAKAKNQMSRTLPCSRSCVYLYIYLTLCGDNNKLVTLIYRIIEALFDRLTA